MRFRVMAQMRTLVRDRSIRGGPEASTAATPKTKRLNYLQTGSLTPSPSRTRKTRKTIPNCVDLSPGGTADAATLVNG